MEKHGFLKYVCYEDEDEVKFKCTHSDEFYIVKSDILPVFYANDVCSNDPRFYQACDKRLEGKITNNELLCEHYLCYEYDNLRVVNPNFLSLIVDRCDIYCTNTVLNKEGCNDDSEKVALPTGNLFHPSDICNDACADKFICEDEGICNGYLYGMYCMMNKRLRYVPQIDICDDYLLCDGGEDEEDCTVTSSTKTSCRHARTGKIVPVHNNTRCGPLQMFNYDVDPYFGGIPYSTPYCELDEVAYFQTNCSDSSRVAVTCRINGYLSTVSKYMICFDESISVCDDHIDSSCYTTKNCNIHKHLLCDHNTDCDDNADEKHPICLSTTEGTCKRRVGLGSELPIPISWLRNGVWDCEDGIDETADWPECGIGKTLRYKSSTESECKNVFICRSGNPGYELLGDLCDGLEKCGNENKICSISSRFQRIDTTVSTTNMGQSKTLSFCRKGVESLEFLIGACAIEQFIFPHGDVFGADLSTVVIVPHKKQSCDYMYGEQYLYTSCTEHCLEATCPLRNIPGYEACPDQFPDRVGTIVNNEYLIFLTKSFGSVYSNRLFVCENKAKCINYSKVCDLVYDCGDGSDEIHCTNHFQCTSSGKLLPKSKKCDRHIDCTDFSDECNEKCSKNLLEGIFLQGISWLIGLLAIAANLVIMGKSIGTMKRCKTSVALINKVLIIMIALGDFMIGCYLFIIATYDSIIFKQDYCTRQITWITSLECSIIGVLSTIGSQISLFSMTGLSIVRIYGIWNSMRIPGEVTMMKSLKIAFAMISLVLASAAIAVVPIVEVFEDFFVNGVRFSDDLKIFVGTPDKATVTEVVQALSLSLNGCRCRPYLKKSFLTGSPESNSC